jgi:tRNA threonylcarbamoyladenosine biosynthesis protein TsaE
LVDTDHVVFQGDGVDLRKVVECGRRLGRAMHAGDLVFLEGPLGAGKTTFVRAMAQALRVTDSVRSPSFTIANIYSGRVTVQHLEDALALEEYVRPDAVTLVEWPEAGRECLGPPTWTVLMDHESIDTRHVQILASSDEGRDRWEEAGKHE